MNIIKKLPQYLINQLKAGEIVERPVSIVKELIENSLDAWATVLDIEIEKGWKGLIKVKDDGCGISKEDLWLTIERHATSKITEVKNLEAIVSYGFRGEALATISEVSGFRVQSKSEENKWKQRESGRVWYELYRTGEKFEIRKIPFAQEYGTIVYVEDVFHVIPAREKFLKSDATEWRYIKKLVMSYALVHRDKQWKLMNNGKVIFNLQASDSLLTRVLELTKKDWQKNLKQLAYKDEQLEIHGLVGDANLHFPRGDYIHIFVNNRPVEDRLIKKALMDAYQRQIIPGTYPFVLLFIDIDPKLVDVNVHPRKQQVKFLDPWSMFTIVKSSIMQVIGDMKVSYASFKKQEISSPPHPLSSREGGLHDGLQRKISSWGSKYGQGYQQNLDLVYEPQVSYKAWLHEQSERLLIDQEAVNIVGQLRDSYIVLEWQKYVYRVDQHALAERIAFEKMRKEVKENGFESEVLLHPLSIVYPAHVEIELILEQLNQIGFDVSDFGNQKVVVHAVPKVFVRYKVDIELMFNFVWGNKLQAGSSKPQAKHDVFDLILDEIFGMKACKDSIKAGQHLSMLEMQQLINDGIQYIEGLFVCQHGRPSIVKIEKWSIDGLFDR